MLAPDDVIEIKKRLALPCPTRSLRSRAGREDEDQTVDDGGKVTHVGLPLKAAGGDGKALGFRENRPILRAAV
jgi:hypothetical protein